MPPLSISLNCRSIFSRLTPHTSITPTSLHTRSNHSSPSTDHACNQSSLSTHLPHASMSFNVDNHHLLHQLHPAVLHQTSLHPSLQLSFQQQPHISTTTSAPVISGNPLAILLPISHNRSSFSTQQPISSTLHPLASISTPTATTHLLRASATTSTTPTPYSPPSFFTPQPSSPPAITSHRTSISTYTPSSPIAIFLPSPILVAAAATASPHHCCCSFAPLVAMVLLLSFSRKKKKGTSSAGRRREPF